MAPGELADDASLSKWRQATTRVLLILCAVGYLPGVAIHFLTHRPLVGSPVELTVAAGYFALLIGTRAGRIATAIGAVITIAAPLIHAHCPDLVSLLRPGPVQPPIAPNVMLTQAALTAKLVCMMILLDSYHRFLLRALSSEQRAVSKLEQEAVERAKAHQNLKREVDERRRLELELARVSDDERRRLGQDVHDGVCQQLTGALLRCQAE